MIKLVERRGFRQQAAMAAGAGASGSDDTCSTNEWRPTKRGARRNEQGDEGNSPSHSSDLDFIADELEKN